LGLLSKTQISFSPLGEKVRMRGFFYILEGEKENFPTGAEKSLRKEPA